MGLASHSAEESRIRLSACLLFTGRYCRAARATDAYTLRTAGRPRSTRGGSAVGDSCEGQLKHLGVPVAPKRSTLAYANEHRPWELYQNAFEQTLSQCLELVRSQGGRKKFRFKNKLMSLDGSIIDLSVSMFDWARFRRTKGAIKLHLLLDHDGYLPSFAVVVVTTTIK
jgi:hypothetical protein